MEISNQLLQQYSTSAVMKIRYVILQNNYIIQILNEIKQYQAAYWLGMMKHIPVDKKENYYDITFKKQVNAEFSMYN